MKDYPVLEEEIREAISFIMEYPEESDLINDVCKWDDQQRISFILGYKIYKEEIEK